MHAKHATPKALALLNRWAELCLATWSGHQLCTCTALSTGVLGDACAMTVLDRTSTRKSAGVGPRSRPLETQTVLRCVVCHKPFDFAAGQTALVLKHIAYGYDFVHDGKCVAAAREWLFVEPGYDRPAFSTDGTRVRILRVSDAEGWAVALPSAPEQVLAGTPVLYEPVACWAMVEYVDGSRHLEGVIRAPELQNEPGAAEFPEARRGRYAYLGYVERMDA
jgi:hypothetical protein